jgi:putative methionine-R-sulfoxide reductase with GAF domain
VAQNDTVIVDDIHSDPRYLACSLEAQSEIVVPIWVNGKSLVKSISIATIAKRSEQRTAAFWKNAQL